MLDLTFWYQNPPDRPRLASHESGHAVVGEALGISALEVSIEEGDDFGGVCRFPPDDDWKPDQRGAIAVAGAIGEAIHEKTDLDPFFLFYPVVEIVSAGNTGRSDSGQLRTACEAKGWNVPNVEAPDCEILRDLYVPFIEMSAPILARNNEAFQGLVATLLAKGTVGGEELRRLLADVH